MAFSVENADFIADKLAAELLPDQEYREVCKNAEEAILRRMVTDGAQDGRIEFDVDWPLLAQTGQWYVTCADNGDAMNRSELSRYTTTLAVRGAGDSQDIRRNQGMGLKVSGPTRHKNGLLIRSLKEGEGWMVQLGHNGSEYGLIPLGPDGELIAPVATDMFPDFIREKGSGTEVTFLGTGEDANTFVPPGRAKSWLFKYLHQRFFDFTQDGIDLVVRVPSGEEEEWPRTPEEAAERMAGAGRSFNLQKVRGTAPIWTDAADLAGEDHHGTLELQGDASADIPAARMHWWVLPTTGSDVSSRTHGGGSIAIAFQNELHDWRIGAQANPYFARLGILFGKPRIAFVLEPLGGTITSDFARAHVHVGGKPVFEGDSWLVWSEQFRTQLPEVIRETMVEEQARLQQEDPDRAKRIRERLRDVMALLRPPRFRPQSDGSARIGGASVSGPDGGDGPWVERGTGQAKRKQTPKTRGIGSVLTQIDPDGTPGDDVFAILALQPQWVTEAEAEGFSLVNGNGNGLHDRAAGLVGEDAAGAPILLLNRDFRGYQAFIAAINDWANEDGNDAKAAAIEAAAQEWVEQKMVEAVNGMRQLENGSTWLASHFDQALSPVGLTAAFMADRYHTLREIRRAVGSLRHEPARTAK